MDFRRRLGSDARGVLTLPVVVLVLTLVLSALGGCEPKEGIDVDDTVSLIMAAAECDEPHARRIEQAFIDSRLHPIDAIERDSEGHGGTWYRVESDGDEYYLLLTDSLRPVTIRKDSVDGKAVYDTVQ